MEWHHKVSNLCVTYQKKSLVLFKVGRLLIYPRIPIASCCVQELIQSASLWGSKSHKYSPLKPIGLKVQCKVKKGTYFRTLYEAWRDKKKTQAEHHFLESLNNKSILWGKKSQGGHCVCIVKKKNYLDNLCLGILTSPPCINVAWLIIRTAPHDSV